MAPRDRIRAERRPGGGGYRAELFIHREISPVRARGQEQLFFSTPEILRARAAASSFSTFLIVIYNWTRGNFSRSIINRARGAKYLRTSCDRSFTSSTSFLFIASLSLFLCLDKLFISYFPLALDFLYFVILISRSSNNLPKVVQETKLVYISVDR